jgi:hypothetical protein
MNPMVGYCAPFFVAAILIFFVSLLTYRRRRARGAWYLIFLCLSASIWAATEGLLYLGLDIKINTLITKLQYLGIAPLPPLALLFALSFFGFESLITRTRVLLLSLIAATIIILVWTNSLHNLIFTDFYTIDTGPFPMLGLQHGLMWWVIIRCWIVKKPSPEGQTLDCPCRRSRLTTGNGANLEQRRIQADRQNKESTRRG